MGKTTEGGPLRWPQIPEERMKLAEGRQATLVSLTWLLEQASLWEVARAIRARGESFLDQTCEYGAEGLSNRAVEDLLTLCNETATIAEKVS